MKLRLFDPSGKPVSSDFWIRANDANGTMRSTTAAGTEGWPIILNGGPAYVVGFHVRPGDLSQKFCFAASKNKLFRPSAATAN